jgi:hypothetical protein
MQHNTYITNRFRLATIDGSALQGGFKTQVDYENLTCLMWLKKVAIFAINT